MSLDETFFTRVGCMDGRVQIPTRKFGQKLFNAEYPDSINDAGIVGILAHNPSPEFLNDFKKKLDISLNHHHSKGILVYGHEDCAGNPVDEETHKKDILDSVELIKKLKPGIKVIPAFVRRFGKGWKVELI